MDCALTAPFSAPLPAGCGILGGMIREQDAPQGSVDRLLARARKGDREAFDQLVALHLPAVWRVVYRVVRHQEDAEDVVQEVFLTAWQGLAGFRGDAKLSTWLHQIALTRALNHLERAAERLRRNSRPLELTGEDTSGGEIDGGPAWEAERRADSPLAALEAQELRRRLAVCLDRLPGAWRVVLALRDGEDMSYEQIAEAVQLALGTVRSRLARARTALRDCIRATKDVRP